MKDLLGRVAASCAAVLAAVALTACGTAVGPASSAPAPGSAVTARAAVFNAADVAFARAMTQVDGQYAAMAGLAAGHATRPQVRALAARTGEQARAQDRQVRGWLRGWHQAAPRPWPTDGWYPMGPGMMGPGMTGRYWSGYWDMMGQGWRQVRGMHGPAFDVGWIAMMGRGYATDMILARGELRSGVSPSARAMARAMLTQRPAGLAQMRGWYRDWGGQMMGGHDWWDGWHGPGWNGGGCDDGGCCC